MARGVTISKPADSERLQMLKRIKWLSDSGRNKLAADAHLIRYRAREPIYLEHSTADQVFFLLAGIAKIYYSHRKQRILVAHLGSGDTFGMTSLFPNSKRRYSSEAVSDCVVLSVDPQTFSDAVFANSFERIGPALANTMGRWFDLTMRYAHFVPLGTRGRLAMSLLEMSRKFGVRDSRGVLLPLTISHAELGTMVGSSRQHVTMQLKEFEHHGFIIRDGWRLIVIPERLETALDN
jgi:CRP/FNR family cyclic AMP-dependent transcriptional regulator